MLRSPHHGLAAMTSRPATRRLLPLALPAFLATWLASGGSDAQAIATTPADGANAPAAAAADAPLTIDQAELLDLAMQSAAKMPLNPHIKNRSRAQEAVVDACLKLGQPARALAGIEDIANW